MRAFVLLGLIAIANAQYSYEPGTPAQQHQQTTSLSGSDQLSDPILISNEFNKEFYSYAAPEQEFSEPNVNEQIANALKRNLRVLFIKGPENTGLENAAIQLAKTASDDRTAIYVLNKQSDIGDLANKLNSLRKANNNKPDVHFIKYRTNADAENAQRTIQSQYDSLPGPTSQHNAGTVPVINFATKAASSGSSGSSTINDNTASSYIPPPQSSAYLPPSKY